jgi:hypothetical protein
MKSKATPIPQELSSAERDGLNIPERECCGEVVGKEN